MSRGRRIFKRYRYVDGLIRKQEKERRNREPPGEVDEDGLALIRERQWLFFRLKEIGYFH